MPRLLAYPIRLALDGSFESVEDGEDYYPQELANLIQTVPGERILVPEYGMEDPVYNVTDQMQLQNKVEVFGPPVIVGDLLVNDIDENNVSVEVEFEIPDDDDDDDDADEDYEIDEDEDLDVDLDATEY